MVTTQNGSDKSSSDGEDQNVVNLCLMTQDDEIKSEHILDFIFNKLQDAFHDLLDEFRKISLRNK